MRERMERANRAAAWERRSGRRLHKSARRASFPAVSKPDRGQHLVAGSAEACAQAVQLLSGAPPCPYYGASDRTRCAPCAIARRWQAGRRRSGRGMDLQTAQPSLCAPPFPYCGAQGAMQALSRGKQSGASASPRDRRRLARRPCSCCPARHPARIMAHRTGRDVLRVPLPAAGKQAGDAVGAVWIYRPRSRLFARHPSRIAAHRARCRRFPAASNPGPAPRRGISGGQRRLARRPCSCCPARHPARILVLRWSAQDAAAEPYEYALDCASDRKAYAWPPLPRTPHPRLTRWQRAFYHPFLWRTLCYGKRWIVRAGKRKDAGASARAA